MSLATRCVPCGTVFRVVQEQLKVSEGWVRCGRCGSVFNALEGLFDLEREAVPDWTPSQQASQELGPASADEYAVQTAHVQADSGQSVSSDDEPGSAIVSEGLEEPDADAFSQARVRIQQQVDFDDQRVGRGEGSDFDEPAREEPGAMPAAPESTPDFLRQADSAERWQRPGVRWVLATAAMLLGSLLAAQVALLQRDVIATRWPQAAPVLALLCEALSCSIDPLRRLEGLVVENSGLTQLENPSLYRLQVSLHNRETVALATPALDVTLTDSRGEVLARKVLDRREFGDAAPATVAAGSDLPLQAVLDAGERRITGYSIEIFYP
jgi:predicted Zn finger-like uncharacterized protein